MLTNINQSVVKSDTIFVQELRQPFLSWISDEIFPHEYSDIKSFSKVKDLEN